MRTRRRLRAPDRGPGHLSPLSEWAGGGDLVAGDNVARGYWSTARGAGVFDAAAGGAGGGWLRTGDLGVLEGGQLYITGRRKEVLIVRGQNLYPQDIEGEARRWAEPLGHGVGAAITLPVPADQIILIHECRTRGRDPGDLETIADRVRGALTREFGVNVSVVLVRIGDIPRTTSGKVQRAVAAETLRTGRFSPLAQRLTAEVRHALRPNAEEFRDWLIQRIAHHQRLPEATIDPRAPLADYGLDSVLVVSLCVDIEDHLQVTLDPAAVWDYPTVDALVGHVAEVAGRSGVTP